MKVLTPGHLYELDNSYTGITQRISFIYKKVENGEELKIIRDGTTNEEVIIMLLDRMNFLQNSLPCPENKNVISNLEHALNSLNQRTKDREVRGVEGKQIK